MAELQNIDDSRLLQSSRVDSHEKEGIKRLINEMNSFDRRPGKDYDITGEKTVDPVPSNTRVLQQQKTERKDLQEEKPRVTETERKDLQEENQKMREDMELVTAKLEYEMECRKNQLYELDSLTLQLRKTHSDLQSMTIQRNSLQANLKTLRRQKCYMVGLFEDLKHRHEELKRDFDFITVQHTRTRVMFKRALQEREYWEARFKSANHIISGSPPYGVTTCPGNPKEEAKSMLDPHNSARTMDARDGDGKKRNRCDFEVGHGQTDKFVPVISKKQYRCARQDFDIRGSLGQGLSYPVQERHDIVTNISK